MDIPIVARLEKLWTPPLSMVGVTVMDGWLRSNPTTYHLPHPPALYLLNCSLAIHIFLRVLINPRISTAHFLKRQHIRSNNFPSVHFHTQWLTLEDAKHGMVHIRLTWLTLSSNADDLQLALEETQLLRVTTMSTALLTVFMDSATNLPVI